MALNGLLFDILHDCLIQSKNKTPKPVEKQIQKHIEKIKKQKEERRQNRSKTPKSSKDADQFYPHDSFGQKPYTKSFLKIDSEMANNWA